MRANWKMGENRNGFKDKVLMDKKGTAYSGDSIMKSTNCNASIIIHPPFTDVYSTEIYTNRTVELLEEHAQSTDTDPFFIYLSYQTPHGPYQAPRGRCNHSNYSNYSNHSNHGNRAPSLSSSTCHIRHHTAPTRRLEVGVTIVTIVTM